jgi:hypothetical protein
MSKRNTPSNSALFRAKKQAFTKAKHLASAPRPGEVAFAAREAAVRHAELQRFMPYLGYAWRHLAHSVMLDGGHR